MKYFLVNLWIRSATCWNPQVERNKIHIYVFLLSCWDIWIDILKLLSQAACPIKVSSAVCSYSRYDHFLHFLIYFHLYFRQIGTIFKSINMHAHIRNEYNVSYYILYFIKKNLCYTRLRELWVWGKMRVKKRTFTKKFQFNSLSLFDFRFGVRSNYGKIPIMFLSKMFWAWFRKCYY